VVNEAKGWLKNNVAAVVTWAILLLGGAVAWGSVAAQIDNTGDRVVELHDDARTASTERATIRSDVRVLETRQQALGETLRSAVVAVDGLEAVVSRLEALASRTLTPR